ncbi:class I adenylate-forming enzyme family protein [Streptomyces indicus]|uniref:Long-chain acyl-CoA synthetase n=1 Tax=Streptomyces indicus TaxID=417292 RepID=A0A1G8ZPI0_9ACTN|nr:AMP-binding protein [Streptomyces indicus]SDK16070.1 long-chain acyl-CoA synthetase [Streptomyces indicus]
MPIDQAHLARLAESAYERLGDHESLVYDGRRHRSGELYHRATRVGAGLSGLGVRPGDRVVVLMANCPEVGITYQAIWRAGAVVTPVMFLVSPPELAHILVDSGARVLVTTADLMASVAAAAPHAPGLRQVVVVDELPPTAPQLPPSITVTPYAQLESAAPGAVADRDGADLAALMYTGGTTGRAKGVMLSHRNLYACSAAAHTASRVAGLTDGINRTLMPLPLLHAYGLIVTLIGWHAEEPQLAVLQRWFDPAQWLKLAVEHRVQRTTLVPSMIQMLLEQPLAEADLSEMRYVSSGAAPLAPDTRAAWQRAVPSSEILEGYGCTESGSVIATTRPGANRPGSVGTPLPGYEIEIRDDKDQALPPGAEGEICVRAQGVMAGYWNAPELTAQALGGGWLHTGDIGRFDEDGYLYLIDRKKDLILRGGFNVFPRDVEDALLGHPAVAAAGVVGRPDPRLGEEVVAFVALHPDQACGTEELLAYGKEQLSAHKYPREIRILDRLPVTSVGKLDRKALRAQVRE